MPPRLRLLASSALASTLFATLLAAAPAGADIEDYADYDGAQVCSPSPKPGTAALSRWLIRSYPGTGSSGISRACDVGGNSEHKEGRAFDWRVDARVPSERRQAYALLKRLFATDRQGNAHALARRMGIMYVIFDDRIWSAYAGFAPRDYTHSVCSGSSTCSPTLRHLDHVHFSLSWAGASAQTSWFRRRGVRSIPVLQPGTRRLDYDATAIARVRVPASGASVRTPFQLVRGVTYHLTATGTYGHRGAQRLADAACIQRVKRGWVRSASRGPNRRGLVVNGRKLWTSQCGARHTHVATFTPTRTRSVRLSVVDPSPGNNTGSLTFAVVRPDLAPRLAR